MAPPEASKPYGGLDKAEKTGTRLKERAAILLDKSRTPHTEEELDDLKKEIEEHAESTEKSEAIAKAKEDADAKMKDRAKLIHDTKDELKKMIPELEARKGEVSNTAEKKLKVVTDAADPVIKKAAEATSFLGGAFHVFNVKLTPLKEGVRGLWRTLGQKGRNSVAWVVGSLGFKETAEKIRNGTPKTEQEKKGVQMGMEYNKLRDMLRLRYVNMPKHEDEMEPLETDLLDAMNLFMAKVGTLDPGRIDSFLDEVATKLGAKEGAPKSVNLIDIAKIIPGIKFTPAGGPVESPEKKTKEEYTALQTKLKDADIVLKDFDPTEALLTTQGNLTKWKEEYAKFEKKAVGPVAAYGKIYAEIPGGPGKKNVTMPDLLKAAEEAVKKLP
jgi:hypothetical protein